MGIERVSGAALSRRVASQPSRTGRLISIRMISGACAHASAMPSWPSAAVITSYPLRIRRRESMSRLISSSSISSILAMVMLCPGRYSIPFRHFSIIMSLSSFGLRRLNTRLHQITHLVQQRLAAVGALLEDLIHVAVQLQPIFLRDVFGRNDDHRNRAPFGVTAQGRDQ